MAETTPNLATLIGSRICHDLISPIGAITNGLELLDMTGVASGPELDLIADSVGNAGARIRFFRIAYGAAGDQMLGQLEIASVLRDVSRDARVQLHWLPDQPQPRTEVRLAFLAMQCCESALPYGGEIRIDATDGKWRVEATGRRVRIDEALWQAMIAGAAPVPATPATVQFALLPDLVGESARALSAEWSDERLSLRF